MLAEQLIGTIIYPALKTINRADLDSIAIVIGTAAQETNLGQSIIQDYYHFDSNISTFEGGLGLWQMQRGDHNYIVDSYLAKDVGAGNTIKNVHGDFYAEKLIYNLRYAAIFCRLHYFTKPGNLPSYLDIPGMAAYYKKWYNTPEGKATEQDFIDNYKNLVAPAFGRFIGNFNG